MLAVIFVLVAGLLLAAFNPWTTPANAASYSTEETAFIQLLNDYRVSQGLQPLLVSDMISEASERHSSDMGKYAFFDHTTQGSDWFPVGASPWDRMAASGYTYNTYKGENIAAGYSTAAAVFQGWENSAGHNANMLDPSYVVVGIGFVYTPGSPYGYYWTTDFGGYADPTAHAVGSPPSTTTTSAPPTTTSTTTPPITTTTTARPTTTTSTTQRVTTTTSTVPPTTTTAAPPPATTTTTAVHVTTTTNQAPPSTTTTTQAPPSTTTTTSPPVAPFSDVGAGTLYADAITVMADHGVVSGYGNGTFGPYNLVTRQQFAKMIVLTLGYNVTPISASSFTDVQAQLSPADPLYPGGYIAVLVATGITRGKTPLTFGPYDHITRAQLITMVARAAELPDPPPGYTPPFPDFSPDHYPWAARAAYAGLLDGLVGMGPHFDFWASATRAEVCELLARLLSYKGM